MKNLQTELKKVNDRIQDERIDKLHDLMEHYAELVNKSEYERTEHEWRKWGEIEKLFNFINNTINKPMPRK